MIEKELKYMLNSGEHETLKMYFEKSGRYGGTHVLENYYFDTPELLLLMTGISFRLRKKDHDWLFTYKCRIKGKLFEQRRKGVLINEEHEISVDTEAAENVIRGEKSLMDLKTGYLENVIRELHAPAGWWDKLQCVGSMDVKRRVWTIMPYGVPVELDEITYDNGDREYELESETEDLALADSVLSGIFVRNGIKSQPSPSPKIVRLMGRKGFEKKLLFEWEL